MNAWNLTGSSPEAPSAVPDEDALSVSQAAELAAGALHDIPKITVLGEVTGFRGPNARSGHCYFQIKDESAALDCIVWKARTTSAPLICATACKCCSRGRSTCTSPRGR